MTEKREGKDTRFKPGQSGNPGGRPSLGTGKIRADLVAAWEGDEGDAPDRKKGIREILLEKALAGDMTAIRIVAERVCAPIRAAEQAAPVQLAEGTLSEQGRSLLAAVASGELAPSQAAQLLGALGAMAKVIETDELAKRIEALEAKNAK